MVTAKRIRLARKLRGLSMDALVRKIDGCVSKMAISKYERGIMMPSPDVLRNISKACGLPIEFFSQQSPTVSRPSFRFDKDNPSDVDRESIQTIYDKAEEYVEAERLAGSIIPFEDSMRRTIRTYEDAEQAAILLRTEWEMGEQPIVSVYETFEMHGIKVLEYYSEQATFDGFSFFVDDTIPFVVVNTFRNTTVERRRFTALHELGHLIFDLIPQSAEEYNASEHPGSHKPPTEEYLANRFAGAVLLPASVARRRLGNQRDTLSMAELISLRNRYGISISSQCFRLNDLLIISYDYRNHIYNDVIAHNKMEEGWGAYPIQETADRLDLLHGRNSEEGTPL